MENSLNNNSGYTIEFPMGAKAQCSQVMNLHNHDYFDSLTRLNPSQSDCEDKERYVMIMKNVNFPFTPGNDPFAYENKPFNNEGTIIISANIVVDNRIPLMHYSKFTLINAKSEKAVQSDPSDETRYDLIEISFEKVINEQVNA